MERREPVEREPLEALIAMIAVVFFCVLVLAAISPVFRVILLVSLAFIVPWLGWLTVKKLRHKKDRRAFADGDTLEFAAYRPKRKRLTLREEIGLTALALIPASLLALVLWVVASSFWISLYQK